MNVSGRVWRICPYWLYMKNGSMEEGHVLDDFHAEI
jgi:hypothetical protein